MQLCHCLRRILFSVLLLCPASAGLPLVSVAQESYRSQMSFRKPFLTPSTASKETPSARPGHAKPFMGWRKAAQDGPATVQHFRELVHSAHAMSLHAPAWNSQRSLASVLSMAQPYASTPPSSYPGILLRPSLPAGSLPSGIATGDFNGDGKLDWVIANAGDNSLCLYLGNGDGTARLPVIIPLLGQSPLSVAAGDLNGDHKLDLVVAEADSKTVGILYGNGDGTFQPEVQIVMPVQTLGVALADTNNDGYLDLLVGTLSDGVAVNSFFGVLLNDGKGNFAAPVYAPNPTPGSLVSGNTFTFADTNADGKLDVLVSGANPSGTTLQLFFGNGNGTFVAGPQIWASNNAPLFQSDVGMAAFADLNGDGCPDITVAMSIGLVNVLFNDCKGNFPQSPSHTYGVGDGAYALAVADVNGDGFPDLITGGLSFGAGLLGYSAGDAITVRFNDGTGKFGPAHVFRGDPSPVGLAVANLKTGSSPYIITANQDADSCSVYANDGTGSFGPPVGGYDGILEGTPDSPTNDADSDYISADLNGDGKPDLAVIAWPSVTSANNGIGMELSVLLNQGDGQFSLPVRSPVFSDLSIAQDFVFGAFRKGTSLLDFLGMAINQSATAVQALQLVYAPNLGNGQFGSPVAIPLPVSGGAYAFGTLAVGDFNNDGNLDFAVGNAGGPSTASIQLTVFLGNGDGTFRANPYQVNFGPTGNSAYPIAMFVGDANGDGLPDIFVWVGSNGYQGADLYEFLGKGDGSLLAPIDVLPSLARMTMVDLNHDGRLDVIDMENSAPGNPSATTAPQITIYLGQPNGRFSKLTTMTPYLGVPSYSIGDGAVPIGGFFASVLADSNGDGNLDLALYQSGGPGSPSFVQFLYGNGDGSFTPTNDIFKLKIPNCPSLAVYNLLGDNRATLVQTPNFSSSYQIIPSAPAPALQIGFMEFPIFTAADTLQIFLNVPTTSATTVSLSASDPNVQITNSVQVPVGQVYMEVPFTLANGFTKNRWFSITAQTGTDTAIAYTYSAPGNSPDSFSLSLYSGYFPPNSSSVAPGQDAVWTATLDSPGLAYSTFTFSCGTLPVGAKCSSFSPPSVPVPSGGSSVSSLTVGTSSSILPGQYSFPVIATDGFITLSSTALLNVGDFALAVSPTSISVPWTSNPIFNAIITPIYGYSEGVTISCSNLPAGMTCPSTSSGNFPIKLDKVAPGTYTITIVGSGTGNSLSHSVQVQIQVVPQPLVSLNQSTLSFNQVLVGATSATQAVVLNNTGDVALLLTGISASVISGTNGSFSQTNNCGSSVAAGGSCSINLTYNPTAVGSATGVLQIVDNAGSSPQQIPLSATAVDFAFQVAPGSASSVSVNAGQSATYNLQVQPDQLQGTVGLSCSGAPAYAHCSWSPTDVSLSGTAAQPVQVVVTTTAPSLVVPFSGQLRVPWYSIGVLALLAVFLSLIMRSQAEMNRRWQNALLVFLIICLFGPLTSCGGGGSGGGLLGGSGGNPGTPSGSYTIVLTGSYGGGSHSINLGLTVK